MTFIDKAKYVNHQPLIEELMSVSTTSGRKKLRMNTQDTP